VTALALPGREAGSDKEAADAGGGPEVVVLDDETVTTEAATPATSDPPDTKTVSVTDRQAPDLPVDLTFHRPKTPAADPAGQASWVLGLALALISEGAAERIVMAEVLAEAAGRSRALEGAYGRAVALLSEYPGDPLVHRTVDLLAKALLRSRRPARAPED
jgi:hypothetical protein